MELRPGIEVGHDVLVSFARRRHLADAAARMRDRLVHHYFGIDLDVLWSTVQDEMPALLALVPPPESAD